MVRSNFPVNNYRMNLLYKDLLKQAARNPFFAMKQLEQIYRNMGIIISKGGIEKIHKKAYEASLKKVAENIEKTSNFLLQVPERPPEENEPYYADQVLRYLDNAIGEYLKIAGECSPAAGVEKETISNTVNIMKDKALGNVLGLIKKLAGENSADLAKGYLAGVRNYIGEMWRQDENYSENELLQKRLDEIRDLNKLLLK